MSLDFMIGKSPFIKDSPEIIDVIFDDEYKIIWAILKKHHNWLFNKVADVYDDQKYLPGEVDRALDIFFDVLPQIEKKEQRQLLFKLITIFTYAQRKKETLWAVAD